MQTAWNNFIKGEFGSPLQSYDWSVFQEKLGKKVLRIEEKDVSAVLLWQTLPLGFGYWYAPRGPVIRRGADISKALERFKSAALEKISKQPERALFLRIEPDYLNANISEQTFREQGFVRGAMVQPAETRIINLKKSISELLNEMKHDTRYAIRAAERRGVAVNVLFDKHDKQNAFGVFWDLFEETAKRHGLKNYSKSYYEELFAFEDDVKTVVITSYIEKTPINASIVVLFGKEAIYLYSASKTGYGRYNAPSLALWKGIQFAKESGCEIFDLWGVSQIKTEWKGITAFKEGFGGEEIKEPGSWDVPLKKIFYRAYRSMAKLPH